MNKTPSPNKTAWVPTIKAGDFLICSKVDGSSLAPCGGNLPDMFIDMVWVFAILFKAKSSLFVENFSCDSFAFFTFNFLFSFFFFFFFGKSPRQSLREEEQQKRKKEKKNRIRSLFHYILIKTIIQIPINHGFR